MPVGSRWKEGKTTALGSTCLSRFYLTAPMRQNSVLKQFFSFFVGGFNNVGKNRRYGQVV
jgi:hypothetical protein